jgi:hypothetical protein
MFATHGGHDLSAACSFLRMCNDSDYKPGVERGSARFITSLLDFGRALRSAFFLPPAPAQATLSPTKSLRYAGRDPSAKAPANDRAADHPRPDRRPWAQAR